MTPKLLLLTCIIAVNSAYCQERPSFVYFLDAKMSSCPENKALYRATGEIDSTGLLYFKCYSRLDNSIVLTAHFSDSTLSKLNGTYVSYFENSRIDSKGNYRDGKEEGLWQRWNEDGKPKDSLVYAAGKVVSGVSYDYQADSNYKVTATYISSDGKRRDIFYNGKGEVISDKTYDKVDLPDDDKVFTKVETDAQFPGGSLAWAKYIKGVIEKHIGELAEAGESGTCIIRFIVAKDGSVSDVEAISMRGSTLAVMGINAIKKGPKWTPAMQNGRPVKAFRSQPITFTLQEVN